MDNEAEKLMNCEYRQKALLYFYGELPARGTDEMRAHLKDCPSCAADLAMLGTLSDGFRAFKPAAPQVAVPMSAADRREPVFAGGILRGFGRLSAAGAFAALVLFAFRLSGASGSAGPWTGGIDSGLDGVEYGIYALGEELAGSPAADFDYGCADAESGGGEISDKNA